MQSGPVPHLRQDHLAWLRHACRPGPRPGSRAAALRVRRLAAEAGPVVSPCGLPDVPLNRWPFDERPVSGPPLGGRFPRIDAVAAPDVSLWASWRARWTTRHTVAAAVLTPVLAAGYGWAAGPSVPLGWLTLLGLLGAVVLASYLPGPRMAARVAFSPCASGAALFLLLALVPLTTGPGGAGAALAAAGMLGMGLAQRVVGQSTCG